MTWFLWDSGMLWPSILNCPTGPGSLVIRLWPWGLPSQGAVLLEGVVHSCWRNSEKERIGTDWNNWESFQKGIRQNLVYPKREICLFRRERAFLKGNHIASDPWKQRHTLEPTQETDSPRNTHLFNEVVKYIKGKHPICCQNRGNLLSAINHMGGKVMLILLHRVI